VGDGLAIHPDVEDAPTCGQWSDAVLAAFEFAPPCQLLDDGADLQGGEEWQGLLFPVGYAEDAEGLVTFTRFDWWKNFRGGGRCPSGCVGAR
jgi:hypothetical protein